MATPPSSSHLTATGHNAAAVDAHATRLLLEMSPPEARGFDSSLGPYVTSTLREGTCDVTNDLVELLESQCQMTPDVARDVLSSIAEVVRTGVVSDGGPFAGGGQSTGESILDSPTRRLRSKSLGAEPAVAYDAKFLGRILQDANSTNVPSLSTAIGGSCNGTSLGVDFGGAFTAGKAPAQDQTKERSVTFGETHSILGQSKEYHQPQAFEPLEGILDVLHLDDEEEKHMHAPQDIADASAGGEENVGPGSLQDEFPQLQSTKHVASHGDKGGSRNTPQPSTQHQSRKAPKSNEKEASDLAAWLFRPSRPRSNSTPISSHSAVLVSPPHSGNAAAAYTHSNYASPAANTAEMNSTVQLLLTLNSRYLGHEAASLATQLTDGDLNLAQYLIEAARSDPSSYNAHAPGSNYQRRRSRICRHELRGVCYRADCPYNHDLSGVTCLFWLKGKCRETNCRFLHGFAESLLEGISQEYLAEQQARKEEQEQRLRQQRIEQVEKSKMLHLYGDSAWSAEGNNISTSYPW